MAIYQVGMSRCHRTGSGSSLSCQSRIRMVGFSHRPPHSIPGINGQACQYGQISKQKAAHGGRRSGIGGGVFGEACMGELGAHTSFHRLASIQSCPLKVGFFAFPTSGSGRCEDTAFHSERSVVKSQHRIVGGHWLK